MPRSTRIGRCTSRVGRPWRRAASSTPPARCSAGSLSGRQELGHGEGTYSRPASSLYLVLPHFHHSVRARRAPAVACTSPQSTRLLLGNACYTCRAGAGAETRCCSAARTWFADPKRRSRAATSCLRGSRRATSAAVRGFVAGMCAVTVRWPCARLSTLLLCAVSSLPSALLRSRRRGRSIRRPRMTYSCSSSSQRRAGILVSNRWPVTCACSAARPWLAANNDATEQRRPTGVPCAA